MRERRWPHRWANRALVGVLVLCLAVLAAGEFYDHSRTDAIIQGRINLDQAEIAANGVTLAEAEQRLDAVLRADRADINSLQSEVAALQAEVAALKAQQATLGSEVRTLEVELGRTPSATPGSSTSSGGAAPPTPQPSPSALPLPTVTPCAVDSAFLRACLLVHVTNSKPDRHR